MITKKRGIALMLSIVMSAGLFAGCGKNDSGSAGGKKTLTVAVFDRGNAPSNGETPDNNRWTKWINEKFGEENNIEVKFHTIPRSQEVEMLNVLMASKEAPDIVFTYDKTVYTNFVKQKGLTDLTDIVKEHGQQLTEFLGDSLELMKVDGKLYGLTAKRPYEGQFISYIRKDWLDKLGLDVPNTPEELYNTLKAFKENDLDGVGKENTIGMPLTAASFSQEDWQQSTLHLVWAFVEQMSKKDFYTLPQIKYPGYKEGVRFLNKMYNDGLIDPDFALQNDNKKLEEHISMGRTGFYTRDINVGINDNGFMGALRQNNPEAEYIACEPFKNKDGISPKRRYLPASLYIMIPSFSKSAVEAVKYLNWMADPEIGFNLMQGEEGEHYKLVEGVPVTIDTEHNKLTRWNNTDLTIIYNGVNYEDEEKYYTSLRISHDFFGPLKEQSAKLGINNGYYDPFYTTILESENKYRSTLNKKFQELMIKSIMAPTTEFDSVYDSIVDEYMSIGGNEIYEEKCKAFEEGKYFESDNEEVYKPYTD